MATNDRAFIPTTIAVLTVSNSRTEDNDKSGKLLVDRVTATGHQLHEKRIVRDDIFQIRAAVSAWIAESDVQVVVTTGGTGVTGHDGTPEAVLPLLEKIIDGFGEIFRGTGYFAHREPERHGLGEHLVVKYEVIGIGEQRQ